MSTTDKQGFFKETVRLAEEYVDERLLLLKLQTAEKTAQLVSFILISFLVAIFAFMILLLLTVIAAHFLVEVTGNWYYGYGIITLVYVTIFLVLMYLRKSLLYRFLSDSVIRMLFEKTDIQQENEKS
jgi:hypothetical protein